MLAFNALMTSPTVVAAAGMDRLIWRRAAPLESVSSRLNTPLMVLGEAVPSEPVTVA